MKNYSQKRKILESNIYGYISATFFSIFAFLILLLDLIAISYEIMLIFGFVGALIGNFYGINKYALNTNNKISVYLIISSIIFSLINPVILIIAGLIFVIFNR